jgi:hypothetical protein
MNGVTELWRSPPPARTAGDAAEGRLKHETFTLFYRLDGKEREIQFLRVVALRITEVDACTPEHTSARHKLVVLEESEWLREFQGRAREDIESTRHYRIFLDDVGCYDVLAGAAQTTSWRPPNN